MGKFERKEYKYWVPIELLDPLRQRFLGNMVHDPHCCREKVGEPYSVRSIYIDTRRFLFYYEKIYGLKIRKKLRIRSYECADSGNGAFIEIKRKFNNTILKERVKMPLAEAPVLFNGGKPVLFDQNPKFMDKAVLDKFVYLIKRLKLEPKVLVVYEREALQGIDDPRMRVTFDMNVRSHAYPEVEDIFREDDLRYLNNTHFILEIKFSGRMPVWIRNIIREFGLRVQAISKYCHGLEEWHSFEFQKHR